jgi:O-antigen ligase
MSSVLVGVLAGAWLSAPFAIALMLVGIPSARPSGLRWVAVGLSSGAAAALIGGVVLGDFLVRGAGGAQAASAVDLATARRVWADAWLIARDFPILGTGLGSFSSVYPFYKSLDASHTTALSSLMQWVVESGFAGLALLTIGVIWCLFRLPGAVRRVGSGDRALAFGLIGAMVGFTLYAVIHWSVELAAVALAASALCGTWDRWLAGATDLFVERA